MSVKQVKAQLEQVNVQLKLAKMPPHSLTNFEIQKYYQNEPKLNGVYSRNNLPKIKDGMLVINLMSMDQ